MTGVLRLSGRARRSLRFRPPNSSLFLLGPASPRPELRNNSPGNALCRSPSFAGHHRSFLADLSRVEEVFKRVGVLILLHQLQIDETLRLSNGLGAAETGC